MKISLILYIVGVVILCSIKDGEVSAQNFLPGNYGGGPIYYSGGGRNDDDFGILLVLLLLAARRGGNCGCCNNARTIPVPYPIPFPTNNAVIARGRNKPATIVNSDESSDDDPVINVITKNIDQSTSVSQSQSNPRTVSNSRSGSSSSNRSGRGSGGRRR